jgi:hypothetical protein
MGDNLLAPSICVGTQKTLDTKRQRLRGANVINFHFHK